jgi:hypothetical protein
LVARTRAAIDGKPITIGEMVGATAEAHDPVLGGGGQQQQQEEAGAGVRVIALAGVVGGEYSGTIEGEYHFDEIPSDMEEEVEWEEAAVCVQGLVRGHLARKSNRRTSDRLGRANKAPRKRVSWVEGFESPGLVPDRAGLGYRL